MNKKITDIRIQKQWQSIEKEPINSVIVKRDEPLSFHFVFYNLEEEYKQGFYHGVLELPEDYPFSPPKIKFLTNNGRFQVDKSICTTFTHYHKETWSSSWNIRTILTAMISFMYSDEKGIGGVFETSSKRKQLAAKSLQQNLKNQKFVELFKEKLIELKLVTPERIEQLMHKGQKGRRRKRERSQATHTQEIREIPQIPQLTRPYDEKSNGQIDRNRLAAVGEMDEETLNRKRELGDRYQEDIDQVAEYEVFEKKRKGEFGDSDREDMRMLQRQKTLQDTEQS